MIVCLSLLLLAAAIGVERRFYIIRDLDSFKDRHNTLPYFLPSTLLRPLFSEHIPLDNLNITMASVAYDLLHKVAPVVAEQFIFQNASTTQNELYGDLNMDHLNWLERQWAAYYIWMGNALLATGVMSFVMHEVSL